MSDWSRVTRDDVIKAIEKTNREKPDYAKSRTTYLIYDNIVYPGKQIRRMAYDDINAKMRRKASPFRDETRVFYDSIRDIEAYRQGYTDLYQALLLFPLFGRAEVERA